VAAGTANFATPTPWKWRTGENHQQLHYHGTLRCMLLPILKENTRPNKGLYERQTGAVSRLGANKDLDRGTGLAAVHTDRARP
jgi:hypothetical protein